MIYVCYWTFCFLLLSIVYAHAQLEFHFLFIYSIDKLVALFPVKLTGSKA